MNEATNLINIETLSSDKQVVEKLVPKAVILKSNSLIVNNRQKNNPVLKHIRNVIWEYGDINPDFQFGITSCALYLSIRYHNLNPEYIHDRLRQLANSYELRVLLVLVDVKDSHHPLKELSKICLLANCTLILAFSVEEAGKYLETYKSFENKPANLIMEKTESDFESQLAEVLTTVRQVNKTDSKILFANIGSFSQLVGANENELAMCPGIGNLKAKKLFATFHQTFLK